MIMCSCQWDLQFPSQFIFPSFFLEFLSCNLLKSLSVFLKLFLTCFCYSSNPVAPESDFLDHEVVSMNDDDLEQLEEEFRRKIELEEEEKKLEETLEYQRRIENEAKQRHLAEQQKKSSGLYLEVENLQDCQTRTDTDSLDSYKHVRETVQVGISLFLVSSAACRETEFLVVTNVAVTWFVRLPLLCK